MLLQARISISHMKAIKRTRHVGFRVLFVFQVFHVLFVQSALPPTFTGMFNMFNPARGSKHQRVVAARPATIRRARGLRLEGLGFRDAGRRGGGGGRGCTHARRKSDP